MYSRFQNLHPFCQVGTYLVLVALTLVISHPLPLFLAGVGAVCTVLSAEPDPHPFRRTFKPFILIIPSALLNALFRSYGIWTAFTLWGREFTWEPFIDGGQAAFRLVIALTWFRSMHLSISTDRLLFLFRPFPTFGLLLSLVLRFLPQFRREAQVLSDLQKIDGRPPESLREKFQQQGRILAALSGSCLETSIHTADSMQARGYGLGPASSYRLYAWQWQDRIYSLFFCGFLFTSLFLMQQGYLQAFFYPLVSLPAWGAQDRIACILLTILNFLPFIFYLEGEAKWHYFQSKI